MQKDSSSPLFNVALPLVGFGSGLEDWKRKPRYDRKRTIQKVYLEQQSDFTL